MENGVSLQLNINSVPRYTSPLDMNAHQYVELADCFGGPFYLCHGAYNAETSAKQLDDNQNVDETQQVGFLKLDLDENGEYVATRQYEINERKAGIANVTYGGVSQKYLRGFQNYLGVNLKKINGMNFQGNGQACGNQAVGIEMKFKDTYNPMYSGQSLLSIYGEVERTFLLKKGKVFVTTSSI